MKARINYARIKRPRTCRTYKTRSYYAAYMTSDSVERKGRHIILHIAEFSVHCKTSFYKRLKSVADTEYKTVSFFQKLHNPGRNASFAQTVRNEFRRTVRLITSTESAGKRKNLRRLQFFFKCSKRVFKHLRRFV